MNRASPPRRVAFEALLALAPGGPTLADRLAEPDAERLSQRDRAFLHELLLGTLRQRGALDHALAGAVDRPLSQIEAAVLAILRLGAYQVLRMRLPARAAVSESVALAHEHASRSAGFVNAILRRLAREGAPAEPDPASDPLRWLTTSGSLPQWLAERWLARLGAAAAVARARAFLQPPRVVVRLNPRVADAPARVAGLSPSSLTVPGALLLDAPPSPAVLADGAAYLQDAGSQLVAHLAAGPGRVLDACAAPGGKSTLLADLGCRVTAVELSARRTATLAALVRRWGAPGGVHVVRGDSLRPPVRGGWDAVLLDAPCSSLGTLGRRPDVRWRVTEPDLARQRERQRALLAALAPLVRPGGRLVYATCSVEPEENEDVVLPFLRAHAEFQPEALPSWAAPLADGPFARTLPERDGGDGFFAARLVRA